ncbi:MAG TPA: alkaline phosphatase family protein [Chitinophagaceae bacterium]|nr:alkaline phosphatase family protein [Chitinophagaceae bacterium]
MSKQSMRCLFACVIVGAFMFTSCQHPKEKTFDQKIKQIKNVVVIYMENHSFDNLYGQFPGANGLDSANKENVIQVNEKGEVYEYLPDIPRSSDFPTNMKNGYFNIDKYIPNNKKTPSPTHVYYHEIMQIDSGKMDKFAVYNSNKGFAMGYHKTKDLPLYPIAKKYTLCDNFFHSGFGGSFFNHVYFIAAAPPVWKDAPESIVAKLDSNGKLIEDGYITPDGYAVNTLYSMAPPYPEGADSSRLLPPQTMPTIGDRLSEKDVSWSWYAAGWDKAVQGEPSIYAYNHEPFTYFANYAPGTPGRKHLKDEKDYLKAAKEGSLPSVSFVKPGLGFDEHPGSAAVYGSEKHALKLINAVMNGPQGDSTLVILTYDENGGFWDHVAPPKIDRWGPGSRVPAIIIGPFAKKGFVDNTQYETVSILAFIEARWGLNPLTDRDKNANPLKNALAL